MKEMGADGMRGNGDEADSVPMNGENSSMPSRLKPMTLPWRVPLLWVERATGPFCRATRPTAERVESYPDRRKAIRFARWLGRSSPSSVGPGGKLFNGLLNSVRQ